MFLLSDGKAVSPSAGVFAKFAFGNPVQFLKSDDIGILLLDPSASFINRILVVESTGIPQDKEEEADTG